MRCLFLALLLATADPALAAATVRADSLAVTETGVTLALSGQVSARVLALDAPLRLVVDLGGVDAARAVADGSRLRVRIGPFDPDTARLVIALQQPMRVAAATQDGAFRLTLKLVPQSPADFAAAIRRGRSALTIAQTTPAVPKPSATFPADRTPVSPVKDFDLPDGVFGAPPVALPTGATVPAPPAAKPPAVKPPVKRRTGPRPLVVIDAGHGGKDVGAVAVDGGYEKNVTLAIARSAARALEKSGQVRVKLTRGDDRFIPLGGRVAIARAAHADLFVSVHADSAPNPQARGASVYTLSETASDAVAARLAARENSADVIGGVNFGVEAPEVKGILMDLLRRSTLNGAATFADLLQDALDERIEFRREFRHFAAFRVLKATEIPSVLFETGYVSNSEDAAFLQSKDGQRTIGEGIARAVETFLLTPVAPAFEAPPR